MLDSIQIKKWGFDLGFDLVSISKLETSKFEDKVKDWVSTGKQGEMKWYEKNLDRRLDPRKNLYGQARTSISVGLFYRPQELPDEIINDPSRGIIARYAIYDDYHKVMEEMLKKLAEKISREIKNWNFSIYVDTGPILEREVSVKAGGGFIGKNTTLINTSLGSYIFLGEIICDLELESNNENILNPKIINEKVEGTCGSCQRCQEFCPTKAFVKPYELDARRCISYLTIENKGEIPIEFRPLLKNRIYGCDICQEVCPWNKKLDKKIISKLKPKIDQAPHLLDLIKLTEKSFKEKYKGLPILRARYKGFMRNVLVAIGNWGVGETYEPVLKLLKSDEYLIRQHAAWALFMIDKKRARKELEKLAEADETQKQEIMLLLK